MTAAVIFVCAGGADMIAVGGVISISMLCATAARNFACLVSHS